MKSALLASERSPSPSVQLRKGRNPRTGAPIDIPASKQPKFKAGKALKDAVN